MKNNQNRSIPGQIEERSKLSRQRIVVGIMIIVILIGSLFVIVDWGEIQQVIREADWEPIPYALTLTLISYVCVGASFAMVGAILGIRMRQRDLAEIGFVSIILNHVLASAGSAGYTVRYILMQRQGVSMKDVLALSILHFYLTSLVMLGLLPIGFIYLLVNSPLSPGRIAVFAAAIVLLVVACLGATLLIFNAPRRSVFLKMAARLVAWIARRNIEPTLKRFDDTMTQGVAGMQAKPFALFLIMSLIVLGWITAGGTLWVCFLAFDSPVGPGVLLTGFVIGIIAGALSLVPGGLGVQEGSMAGIFALLGISFERAVLVALLFRGVYYLVPYLVSLGFYGRLLKVVGDK